MYYIILYFTMLYYIILYYIILYCTILCYIILYYFIFYYIILYYIIFMLLYYIISLRFTPVFSDCFRCFWLLRILINSESHEPSLYRSYDLCKRIKQVVVAICEYHEYQEFVFSRYFTYVNPYTVSGLSYSNLYSVYWCGREQGNCYKCHSLNDAIYPPSFTLAHRGHHPPSSSPKPRRLGGSEILTLTSALKEALAKGLIDLVRTRSPRSKVLAPWCEVTHAVGASGMVNGKVTSCGMYHSIVVTTCM